MAQVGIGVSGVLSGFEPPESFSITQSLNAGWMATLVYGRLIKHRVWSEDTTVVITFSDGQGATYSTPPMRFRTRSRSTSTGKTTFELIDETSLILSGGAESFDTFIDTTSGAIVSAVGARWGVSVSGHISFLVWKEDVKLSTGWAPLQRIAAVAGEQLMVTNTGAVQFVSNATTAAGTMHGLHDEVESFTPGERYYKLFVSKNLGMGTATGPWRFDFDEPGYPSTGLDTPIYSASATVTSRWGKAHQVGFWDAEDKLIAIFPILGSAPNGYNVPTNGTWPAVKFTVFIEPEPGSGAVDLTVVINGTTGQEPPPGIDPAISETYGTGRGLPATFAESLIPSKSYADGKWEDWLKEINRGKDTIAVSGPLSASARLLMTQLCPKLGLTGRVEEISWSGQPAGECVTTLHVEVGV